TWFGLMREGDVHARVVLRGKGEYAIRVKAAGDQAGPEAPKMAIRWNGADLKVVEVPERRREARLHEVRIQADRGTHKIAVAYLNNYVNPKEKDPRKRDRNLLLEFIEIEGPLQPVPQSLPETHQRIFFTQPSTKKPAAAAREIIGKFAFNAWRRPVERAELDRLMKLFELGQAQNDSFEKSVKLALQAAMVSPHFLFRGELQPEPDNPKQTHLVNEFALASRLSYFLWSTMPDAELLKLAGAGRLRRNLAGQVERMLKDPKRDALLQNFFTQWLQTRSLQIAAPDVTTFPAFSPELRRDMARETELFVDAIIRENRSLLDLLDADFSYLNGRLAKHYGLEGVEGDEFRRVSFKDGTRGGILTQGAVLTITSNPTRTSPVKRGKWVLENLLAAPPPPPPPNVPELKIDKEHPLTGTLRERMEQHRANPGCASCHDRMDAIGFAFENYDAIGAWRTQEGGASIDASGELMAGVSFNGPAELKKLLVNQNRDDFIRCVVEKTLTYALGRGIEHFDRCAVNAICVKLSQDNYRFSTLIQEIVKSAPFQKRRGEGSAPVAP
ncbi:MAG: DUF1592 domain-containing protein, partial [Verrucomicrobia bacterium]|nr:DUF1592 domain-containing protein [Verrucomicrobiota bacterium]